MFAVVIAVALGGWVTAGALEEPPGRAVDAGAGVRIRPASDWEVAGELGTRVGGVRLTNGVAALDVLAAALQGGPAQLLGIYVSQFLEPDAAQLRTSRAPEPVPMPEGLTAVRISYVGVFGDRAAPIEGEVTAAVTSSGIGIVLNGWAPEGGLRRSIDDIREMVRTVEVQVGAS